MIKHSTASLDPERGCPTIRNSAERLRPQSQDKRVRAARRSEVVNNSAAGENIVGGRPASARSQGLSESEQIIASPPAGLVDGTIVTIAKPKWTLARAD